MQPPTAQPHSVWLVLIHPSGSAQAGLLQEAPVAHSGPQTEAGGGPGLAYQVLLLHIMGLWDGGKNCVNKMRENDGIYTVQSLGHSPVQSFLAVTKMTGFRQCLGLTSVTIRCITVSSNCSLAFFPSRS